MTNKTAIVGGFVLGVSGFLLVVKFMVLDNVPPSDELGPGIVVLISFFNGLLFGFVGHRENCARLNLKGASRCPSPDKT